MFAEMSTRFPASLKQPPHRPGEGHRRGEGYGGGI